MDELSNNGSNEWSGKRKRIIFWSVLTTLIILIGVPSYLLFYRTPTCMDGKMNGDETGIDCGGSCELICSPESLPLLAQGDPRVLTVAPGIYEVVTIFENPNAFGEVYRAPYTIKVYGSSDTAPVKIISGETFIQRGSIFAIFEGPFGLTTPPVRATFEWGEPNFSWKRNSSSLPNINIRNTTLSKEETTPRIDSLIENPGLSNIPNIELIVLVTSGEGNIIAASKTFIDVLGKEEQVPVVFTWPTPFSHKAVGIEIIPRFFPDRSYLR